MKFCQNHHDHRKVSTVCRETAIEGRVRSNQMTAENELTVPVEKMDQFISRVFDEIKIQF